MSSFIGHAATGAAIALAGNGAPADRLCRTLPLLVLLAVCADFDYLLYWSLGIDLQPRFTHSLAFALAAAMIALGSIRIASPTQQPCVSLPALLLAAGSHPLLDLLVGVHSLPLFWPFASAEVASPIGLLPSAAHVSLTNYYLWRNLLVEMGVLLPVLSFWVAASRTGMKATIKKTWMLMAFPWFGFLLWSMSLQR